MMKAVAVVALVALAVGPAAAVLQSTSVGTLTIPGINATSNVLTSSLLNNFTSTAFPGGVIGGRAQGILSGGGFNVRNGLLNSLSQVQTTNGTSASALQGSFGGPGQFTVAGVLDSFLGGNNGSATAVGSILGSRTSLTAVSVVGTNGTNTTTGRKML